MPEIIPIPMPVTLVVAGLMAFWLIYLQAAVIRIGQSHGISLGDGGDEACARAVRAHGNAAETVPIFLILLALVELQGAPLWALVFTGTMFTAGRLLHGVHFMRRRKGLLLRVLGMALTLTATALVGAGALYYGASALTG
ncbi:MAG: MAPEG family protein [Pseudomonadota bacterium]